MKSKTERNPVPLQASVNPVFSLTLHWFRRVADTRANRRGVVILRPSRSCTDNPRTGTDGYVPDRCQSRKSTTEIRRA